MDTFSCKEWSDLNHEYYHNIYVWFCSRTDQYFELKRSALTTDRMKLSPFSCRMLMNGEGFRREEAVYDCGFVEI